MDKVLVIEEARAPHFTGGLFAKKLVCTNIELSSRKTNSNANEVNLTEYPCLQNTKVIIAFYFSTERFRKCII
jgi:hypothetical protein